MGLVRSGCVHSSNRTLKLSVSEEWIDGINWFFTCWCKSRKAKSHFNRFLDGCGQKWARPFRSWDSGISPISQEWIDEMNQFLVCWYWCNKFWLGCWSYPLQICCNLLNLICFLQMLFYYISPALCFMKFYIGNNMTSIISVFQGSRENIDAEFLHETPRNGRINESSSNCGKF